jgi:hypothetical protein
MVSPNKIIKFVKKELDNTTLNYYSICVLK